MNQNENSSSAKTQAVGQPNPFAASEPTETYYGEFIDSIPFGALVNLLAHNLPRPVAWWIVACLRVKSWLAMPTLPTAATGAIGSRVILPRQGMPARPMSRWAGKLETLDDLGFDAIEFSTNVHIGAKESASVLLLDEKRSTFATLEWFRMPGADGIEERTTIEFNSILVPQADHQFNEHAGNVPISEVTTLMPRKDESALREAFMIDGVDIDFLPSTLHLAKAYRKHIDRLRSHRAKVFGTAEAISAFEELTEKRLQWMMSKGYMRELTPRQIEIVRRHQLEPHEA